MRSKILFVPLMLTAFLVLSALPLPAAQPSLSLADFDGTWLMDAQKSRANTTEAVNKLNALIGFKFSIAAEAKTIRMEWVDHEPRTSKILSSTGQGQELSCRLEGQNAPMLLEKISDDEVHVKDRDETLVFIKVK